MKSAAMKMANPSRCCLELWPCSNGGYVLFPPRSGLISVITPRNSWSSRNPGKPLSFAFVNRHYAINLRSIEPFALAVRPDDLERVDVSDLSEPEMGSRVAATAKAVGGKY